jgi:hypothetical protein
MREDLNRYIFNWIIDLRKKKIIENIKIIN